jgi:hypothetical protein
MKHPGHTYGGFIPAISERGMTKAITPDPNLFHRAHFHMLQQMSIVFEYLDEHKEVLLRDNRRCNESWLANEHMRIFIVWLWDPISLSYTPRSEYLKKLALVAPYSPLWNILGMT